MAKKTTEIVVLESEAGVALAQRLGLSVVENREQCRHGILLFYKHDALYLELLDYPEYKAYSYDLLEPRLLERFKQNFRADPLRKALGKFARDEIIWDFTFGLGKDAVHFARLGLKVKAWERSPYVFEIWNDADRRACSHSFLGPLLNRIELVAGDARKIARNAPERPALIYIDPMYPELDSVTKRKKELVLLRELVGEDADGEELYTQAQRFSPRRIVIKRPKQASILDKPALQVWGKSHRFDVYIHGVNYK